MVSDFIFVQSDLRAAMAYQQTYAESADWLMTQFKDWAIIFVGSILHFELVDTKEAEGPFSQTCRFLHDDLPTLKKYISEQQEFCGIYA